jgi:hypothetical protein
VVLTPLDSSPVHRPGEWGPTAICENDITSSCLYVAASGRIAVGNILLKIRRRQLPRHYRAGWPTVVTELAAIVLGLIGDLALNPRNVWVFLLFTPGLIERLGRQWGIPTNSMFIGSSSGRFPYRIAELHGGRLII